ncbi:MAG: helix-turn-helix transcriptional regulator [Bacilli bacterium]|nr:helix-turn-helix transcriptional regulator [Bacilli bacterium]
MEKQNKLDILEMLGNYGHYVCNVGQAMDKAGISISKMRRLTGLNHEIVKKYYEDRVVRIDKDVLSRITYVLVACGIDPKDIVEYVPPEKKMNMKINP